jgi:hypothetical protein
MAEHCRKYWAGLIKIAVVGGDEDDEASDSREDPGAEEAEDDAEEAEEELQGSGDVEDECLVNDY